MNRTSIINYICQKTRASSYLEIGANDGQNFNLIDCPNKEAVDPGLHTVATHYLSSDDFFSENESIFDVIFVDGLHHRAQVYRDLINSLEALSPTGVIICHDVNPPTKIVQEVPRRSAKGDGWTGDCWKAWAQLRAERPDLTMFTVDADWGCGIIFYGFQELINLNVEDLTWENFSRHRTEWLNLTSPSDFKSTFISSYSHVSATPSHEVS